MSEQPSTEELQAIVDGLDGIAGWLDDDGTICVLVDYESDAR